MKKLTKIIVCLALVAILATVGAFALTACNKKVSGPQIGYQNGTTGGNYIKGDEDLGYDGFSNVKAVGYNTAALAVQDLTNGNLDVVIVDDGPAKTLAQSNNKIKVIDIALTEEIYGFAVNKSNSTLETELNTWLATNTTQVEQIIAKYLNGSDVPTYTSKTLDSSKKQVILATNAAFPPFEYKEGNAFGGIDIELIETFAAANGYEVVIEDMEFDGIVTYIGNTTNAIGAAAMSITEARKQTVNFSTPYFHSCLVAIVKADNTKFDSCQTADDVIAVLKAL